MNKQLFNKPKAFGEILDLTFQLSKNRFVDFMKIFLILLGPIFVLEAIVYLMSGVNFFRETGPGTVWFEQIINSFVETEPLETASLGADLGIIGLGLVSILLYPIAQAAVLFAVNHIRKGEEFKVGDVIKQAFSRFWAILWGNIVFFFVIFGIMLIPIIAITSIVISMGPENIIGAVILIILLGFIFFFGFMLLITRLSFYFGSIVLDKITPGIIRSWKLSRKRTWPLFGLYIIFYVIIGAITFAVETSFGLLLGNSVLLLTINNLALLFTTMVVTVGYSVMFLDLKTRHNADDLKEMLDDYQENNK
ncbi:hypothetical protein [Evansella tamaricis]|uniref:hypothetical protein n=1 Tax=Evansella tamaricis TaxID=2069301 RepID=UPI0031B8038F